MNKITPRRPTPRVALLIESSRSYGRELLMGIAKYLRIHGPWSVEFEEGDPSEIFPVWFDRWEWDGIIARVSNSEMAEAVKATGAPVIDLSGNLPGADFLRIRSDEDAVGRLAAEHLLERGFHHFAFCGYEGMDWSDLRRESFEQRVEEEGFKSAVFEGSRLEPASSLTDQASGADQERDLMEWLRSLPKPCGIMACNDARGRQVLTCCRKVDVDVPDEVAVIGVDRDEIFCELSDLPLSSVVLNTQQIGFESAALLAKLMAGGTAESSSILVDPMGVMARQSTDVLAIDDPHIATALKYIREHACQGLDVGALLKAVPLSRSVLERRFSQLLGKSPKAEILRVQLDRVCRLLAESDLPISEVAEKSGFEHPEYMSRLFKKKIGITPGEFRKRSGVRDSGAR